MALGRKTGGRVKGTPNKREHPLKRPIREYLEAQFERKERVDEDTGKRYTASDFELDMAALEPGERIQATMRLLRFVTPEMKAVEMETTSTAETESLSERRAELAGEE